MLLALINIIGYVINIIIVIVIVQFVISLLFMFNVISPQNQFASGMYQSLNMILDPLLRPIKRILPDTGMIDFSPIVLIIGLNILQQLLGGLYNDYYLA